MTTKTMNLGMLLNRRRTLAMLGGASVLAAAGKLDAATCVSLAGAQTEGPYWIEQNLNRSDIRIDPSGRSIRPGVLLNLTIYLVNENDTTCVRLSGAKVDIWHCDAGGTYSDEAAHQTTGKKFLRGYPVSDDNGQVNFTTIYPGRYSGGTVQIHVRIRTYQGTTQIGNWWRRSSSTIPSRTPSSRIRPIVRGPIAIPAIPTTWSLPARATER